MTRRMALLVCVFLAGLGVGRAAGQGSSAARTPRMWGDRILDVATEEIPRRTRVWTSSDHWDPGAETGRHTHPGPTVFVLLEGELEETLADGRTRTLKAGQAYWKPVQHGAQRAQSWRQARPRAGGPSGPPVIARRAARPWVGRDTIGRRTGSRPTRDPT